MAAVHRVMHSVSASIEYVCSTTTAANSGPTTSLCIAGNATRAIAAIEGASAMTAVRTTSVAPGLVISVLRREYSLACARVLSPGWVLTHVGAGSRPLYQLDSIAIRIAHQAQPRSALADRLR